MKVTVKQGQVRVHNVLLVSESDELVVLSVDLHTKYAEASGDSGDAAYLGVGERTLYADLTADAETAIHVEAFERQHIMHTVGRYTCTILVVNAAVFDKPLETLWESP